MARTNLYTGILKNLGTDVRLSVSSDNLNHYIKILHI